MHGTWLLGWSAKVVLSTDRQVGVQCCLVGWGQQSRASQMR